MHSMGEFKQISTGCFGIIFDTFVNKEARHSHKDIAMVINNGDQALDVPHGGVIPEDSVGCDADFRYASNTRLSNCMRHSEHWHGLQIL